MTSQTKGIDLETVKETMGELEKDPELGRCVFRTSNRWDEGTRNVSRFEGFYAVKQEMPHARTYEFQADEPTILSGEDSSPTPVEYLLGALASCVTNSMILHGAMRGITIEALSSGVEGHLDLNGFAGFDETVPKGYQSIRIDLRAKSDADEAQLKELAYHSPTLNTIRESTRVELNVHSEPLSAS